MKVLASQVDDEYWLMGQKSYSVTLKRGARYTSNVWVFYRYSSSQENYGTIEEIGPITMGSVILNLFKMIVLLFCIGMSSGAGPLHSRHRLRVFQSPGAESGSSSFRLYEQQHMYSTLESSLSPKDSFSTVLIIILTSYMQKCAQLHHRCRPVLNDNSCRFEAEQS